MGKKIMLVLCIVWVANTFIGCGSTATTGTPTPPPPPSPSSSNVLVFMKDAPADNVLALRVNVTGVSATDSTGQAVSLSNTSQSYEMRHLELAPTLGMVAANVPSGNYTSMTFTFANPQLTVIDSAGNIKQATTGNGVTLAQANVTVPGTMTFPAGGTLGAIFDLDLGKSVSTDASGNYVITPTFSLAPITNSNDNQLENSLGQVMALGSGTFDLQLLSTGNTIRVAVNSATQFDTDIAQFSNIKVGQLIEVDAQMQTDGTFVAKFVEFGGASAALRVQGLVSAVQQDAQGNTSFNLVARN